MEVPTATVGGGRTTSPDVDPDVTGVTDDPAAARRDDYR
jgi:hypothetical protein